MTFAHAPVRVAPSPALHARALQLLGALEMPCGLLALPAEGAWTLHAVPGSARWPSGDYPPDRLIQQLGPVHAWRDAPGHSAFDLGPTLAKRRLFQRPVPRRALTIHRLDDAPIPGALLIVAPHEGASREQRAGRPYRDLLIRQSVLEPPPSLAPSNPAHWRSWESLAEMLDHGILFCDAHLRLHYCNASAQAHLGLEPASVFGSSLLELPWHTTTKQRLAALTPQAAPLTCEALFQRGTQTLRFEMRVSPQSARGYLCECRFPRIEGRASWSFVPLESDAPSPLEVPPPGPQWTGSLAALAIPASAAGVASQQLFRTSGQTAVLVHLHLPTQDPRWADWARDLMALIGQRAQALVPVTQLLSELNHEVHFPRLGDRRWSLGVGRFQADQRCFEWGALGGAQLLRYHRDTAAWVAPLPERVLHLGFGCPPLRLFGGTLLPGEGLWLGAPGGDSEDAAVLPAQFERVPWRALEALARSDESRASGGGFLVRQSIGVEEQSNLTPEQFELYCNTLRLRLLARGVDEHTIFQLRVALDELLSNAFRHGHQGDYLKGVAVGVLLEEGCIRVSIRDQGAGFNCLELKDPTAPEAILEAGGRGIYLTTQMMDAVEFGERTNHWILTRYYVPRPFGAALPADSAARMQPRGWH